MIKKLFFLLLFFGFFLNPEDCFGFNFSITTTAETCSGNGSLNFTVTNKNPNGSILFYIYKLPDTAVPIATISGNSLTGLDSGDYLIIAKETVGNTVTSQQLNATIVRNITPLAYSIKMLNQACSSTSNISITTIAGNPATYQIISGPVLFPSQTSNTFTDLPVGVYKVKVVDVCGNSVVQTFTVTLNTASLSVSSPAFSELAPVDCNKVKITQTITAALGTVIGYPLTVKYELNLPGSSSPTVITKTINSGDLTSEDISEIVPNYINQSYSYSVTITDSCGTTYPSSNFQVSPQINLIGEMVYFECNRFGIKLTASHYAAPYTLNFTSFPAGFVPQDFNSTYPGPFGVDSVLFGGPNNPLPFGDYEITINDACGRSISATVQIISKPPQPISYGVNNGCLTNTGSIHIEIPNYKIVTAVITSAPADYPYPLPHDVTATLDNNGILNLSPVPLGDYSITLTNNCNDMIQPISLNVPIYIDQGILIDPRPGCDLQKTSVKIKSFNGKLTNVKITSAPAAFSFALPYDVSNHITSNGILYLDNLPGGDYTFSTLDQCNFTADQTITLDGYNVTTNKFSLIPNCGSYDIELEYICNGNTNESFWLQKQLPTGDWGNPYTNAPYSNGGVPNDTDSLVLTNNTTLYNLTLNGTFRIVHYFQSYYNGEDYNNGIVSTTDKDCIEFLLPPMSFNQVLEIVDVYRMPCNPNGNLDVVIIANGTPPLQYSIINSNGDIVFNNGNSNIFKNLPVGTYRFQVEDSCGNSVNSTFDVSDLVPLAKINPICDQLLCVDKITGNESFDLTALNDTILGDQSPSQYTLSYHNTAVDAQTGANPIINQTTFVPQSNPQKIYIRLYYNSLPSCYQTGSFSLMIHKNPKLSLKSDYLQCSSTPVDLNASIGNLPTTTYLWSNGSTQPVFTVSKIGTTNISVTASDTYGICDNMPLSCSLTKDISITLTGIPEIDHVETQDWTDTENSITVITKDVGVFEYSLDGIHFQAENRFSNLIPGFYTVYVRDLSNCKTVSQSVVLLNYPKFFTPNGDGYNETWRIKNSELEPNLKVEVYDRYGKLMAAFDALSSGWDGNYNGQMMFSDDYWFVVYRQDGKIHKGHFTLKR